LGRRSFLFIPALLLATTVNALELSKDDLRVTGYVDGGRFQLVDSSVDGELLNRMGAKWKIDKQIDENWSAMADLHWMFWRNQATDVGLFHVAGLKFDADLQGMIAHQADARRFKFGLYEFKYNPDAKNLGEYLLRSEAYPTILESSQGKDLLSHATSRVAGLEYGLHYGLFRTTALLYAEQHNIPVNDISAAYFAAAGPESAELGFGAAYHRFYALGNRINNTVLNPEQRAYVERQGLEAKAVKLSLRGRVDLAALLEMEDDFKLYGETALLGLKNDSLFYKHQMHRVPVMAGVNIPTFRFLNTLSVEVEYFSNPYLGRKYAIKDANGSNFSALPFIDDYSKPPTYSKDDWKWSVYMHKALNKWLDVKLRCASDHLRLKNWDGDYEGGEPMTGETWNPMKGGNPFTLFADWYFIARIEYHN
jgi:hypothetical protein